MKELTYKIATIEDYDDFYTIKCDPENIKWSGFATAPDYECMKEYYNASKLGYVFTDKDLSDFEMAYNNGSSDLRERIKNYKKQIDDIGRLGFIGDLEAAEKKLAELNEWHAAVRRAQGRENSTL